VATEKIKTKKLNDLQQHALDELLKHPQMNFRELYHAGIMSGTSSWLTKNGLTVEVAVPVEGRPPTRAWQITDAGREAQSTGRYVPPVKAPTADASPDEAGAAPTPRKSASLTI
jgi:hypothetical protein